ncbi:MAG: hypothetical protein ABIR66_03965 [Saprospiraceae bacterium]
MMIKVIEIIDSKGTVLICKFNNQEIKSIDFDQYKFHDKFIEKIIETDQLKDVRIGDLGQLYWPGQATIQEINGEISFIDYDVSAEFVYINSTFDEPSMV